MNYGRHQIENEQENLISGSGSVGKSIGAYGVRALFFIFAAIVIIILCSGYGFVKGILDDTPDVASINISPSGYATFIYDSDGNQLQKLVSTDSNRMAVSIDRVPKVMQDAVIAIEDERFYQHNGVDAKGIIRALVRGVQNKFRFTEGASTITQQLLKNNVFTQWTEEKTLMERVKRKIQEQTLAVELEKRLDNKKLILENYMNTINLGAGTYGVEAAAKKYFNKDVWDLNLSEAVTIAGITRNPARYNPITHPDYNQERREVVLDKMVELGYITQAEADEALADDVYTRINAAQESGKKQNTVYSYFVDELTAQVVEDLMNQKGYTKTQAEQALYSGGLRIYTTQDQNIQKICDEEFINDENYPNATAYELDWAFSIINKDGETVNYSREMLQDYFQQTEDPEFSLEFESIEKADEYVAKYKKHILKDDDTIIGERISYTPQPQASVVVMDQDTGYVKAIVGGRGKKTASLTLNRATSTYRQPGSTFKILSTYAPALDSEKVTLATTYVDEPYKYTNGTDVRDWLANSYQGAITVREAIINSINVVAVKCLTEITPKAGYNQLLKFGFTSLSETNDVYQPLALGGIYNGVSNLELTAAYAAIANKGVYTKPLFYTKIMDQYGNVIIDNTAEASTAIKSSTAFLLTSAMESVVERGTGQSCQLDNMPVAGKTGTTSDYRDIWFVGYTPYYTCGVWCGFDNNSPLPNEGTYRDYNKVLWKAIMSRIHENLPAKEFTMPSNVGQATVCESTTEVAGSRCRKSITEYFSMDTLPTQRCTKHTSGREYDAEDFLYYGGYGSGGNGRIPGAYALGADDIGKFTYDRAQSAYNNYRWELEEEARREAEEEARRQREEEEARRKAAEEAARQEQENEGTAGGTINDIVDTISDLITGDDDDD